LGKAFIVTPKYSDLATLTASDAVSGAGATNLQKARPKLYWRSTSNAPYLVGDLGASRSLDTLVLGYLNAQALATFRLRLASTEAGLTGGSPAYDSTSLDTWPSGSDLSAYALTHRLLNFTSTSATWFRVDFYFGASTVQYAKLGRLILGEKIEPATSVAFGWAASFDEPVAETVDLGGEESPRLMGARRTLEATWQHLTHGEHDRLYQTLLERGSARDLALVIDPDFTSYPMPMIAVGRVKRVLSFPNTFRTAAGAFFSLSAAVTEMAPTEMT